MKKSDIAASVDIEQIELKSFSRSIAEIEWLLLILILLYYISPGAEILNPYGMVVSLIGFTLFVLSFHYFNFYTRQSRWKLAIESWVMIAFISWTLYQTGGVESPLLNLYLLVIIASAITLGKMITLLEIGLIATFYFYLAAPLYSSSSFTLSEFSQIMTLFSPFLLIAYITTMLASDVHYGRQMFKSLSETDEMTGLLNKRSFNTMLIKAEKVAKRYGHPMSVMVIDADNLKTVNDQYGHKAGDRLIMMLGEIIQDCLRISDVISRYGGDEFVILLPQTTAEKALDAGSRICLAVQNSSFDVTGNRINSTVSIGIASYPSDAVNVNELMEKADASLYQSKKQGKNQVTHYSYYDSEDVTERTLTPV
jgi:diguanylate cyclase (GGDEF)-like protein